MTTFARDTPWLNTPMVDYSSAGMVLFAVLILTAWWIGRRSAPSVMAAAIGVPIAAVSAYLVNDGIKWLVSEQRPCYALPEHFCSNPARQSTTTAFPAITLRSQPRWRPHSSW
ncbi:hypothetical protein ACETU7_21770 [Rhodococcus sp. 3Y1]